ncbi:hypothetical protein [Celeribacter sp.]
MSIGQHPEVSLSQAGWTKYVARSQVAGGIDPSETQSVHPPR